MTGFRVDFDVEPLILYERDHLIAVNKPPWIPSTGRTLDDPECLQHKLIARNRGKMIWAVHQLDALTSGVNLFVARKSLVAVMTERLKRFGTKSYVAVCHGAPDLDRQRVDVPLGWVQALGRRGVTEEGQRAVSDVTVLSRAADAALIEVVLHTGRTHQIRIHMAHLGHPLFGEARYRDPASEGHARNALHAASLSFKDDQTRIEAPLPDDLRELAGRLGLDVGGL